MCWFDSAGLCRSGGEITSTFDHPELVKIGHCKLIEEVMIGEDNLIHFSGVDMGKCWPFLLTCSRFAVIVCRAAQFGQRCCDVYTSA